MLPSRASLPQWEHAWGGSPASRSGPRLVPGLSKKGGLWTILALPITIALLLFPSVQNSSLKPATASKSSVHPHLHATRLRSQVTHHQARVHQGRRHFSLLAFERCVVFHESSGNRYAVNGGGDESYYQWAPPTWQNAQRFSHVWYSSFARDSSLEKQTIVFRRYEPTHSDEWTTIPECGG